MPVRSPGLVSWAEVASATPADDREGPTQALPNSRSAPTQRGGSRTHLDYGGEDGEGGGEGVSCSRGRVFLACAAEARGGSRYWAPPAHV